MSKDRKNCMCTAMLFDPKDHYEPKETAENFKQHSGLYERFNAIKQHKLLNWLNKKDEKKSGNLLKSIFGLLALLVIILKLTLK